MAIRPLDDRVLLQVLDAEETTAGGIVLPDSAREKPQQGKVTAIGEGKRLDGGKRAKPDVKKGDIVLFGKYSGTEVKIGGEEHLIMREDDILAVIEK